jgi:multicomponent Na+:H+ antiporter subunit F
MADFLGLAALVLLVLVGIGLLRLLRGPATVDRMMAIQLAGTGCAGVALLLGAASGAGAMADIALTLALLAALAAAGLRGFAIAPVATREEPEP